MTFSKIGNEKCGSPFQRMIPPDKGSAETGCRFCRYRPSDGLLFFWTMTTARTVFQIKNAIWRKSCPPENRIGVCVFGSPERVAPPLFNQTSAFADTFGREKAGGNAPEKRQNLFRKICPPIPEHRPAQTPSGLRADNPTHHKSFPTHPRASASQNPHRLRTP